MPTANETIVQRWGEELWNANNLAVIDEIIAPDFTDHDPARPVLGTTSSETRALPVSRRGTGGRASGRPPA